MSPLAPQSRRRLAIAIAAATLLGVTASPAIGGPLPDPLVATDGNLLNNPSFENKDLTNGTPVSWSVQQATAGTAKVVNGDGTVVHSGKGSLQVVDGSNPDNVLLRSSPVPGQPGVAYTARAWVRNSSGTTAWLYLEFWGVSGSRLAAYDTRPAASSSWTQTSPLSATAPDGTVHVTVALYGGVTTTGTSLVDDVSLVAAGQAYTPALGSRRELFLDDYRIESATDVERVVHPAVKRATPLIVADKPWETSVYIYGSVVTDSPGSPYKMWYTCFWDNPVASESDVYYLCYATSTDGVTWTKPNLGKVTFGGNTQNNIIGLYGGTVTYNPNEPADRRYRLMDYRPTPSMGYYASHSADGITWTTTSSGPVLTYGDVSNVSYDAANNRYIAVTKQRTYDIATIPGTIDRMAWVSTSTDFVTWSTPRLAVESDARDDAATVGRGGIEGQIYGMPVYPYESTYIGLPWMFEVTGSNTSANDGPIAPQLASSRDLVRWSRPERDPILPLGRAGAWDDGMIFTSTTFQVSTSAVTVYYGGFKFDHAGGPGQTAKISTASWRRDGFASLFNAGDDPGTVTTKPITFAGGTLHLNAVAGSGGSIKVEVLPATGTTPVTGFAVGQSSTVTGDQLDATLSWSSGRSLSELAGQQVRLKFYVDGADLYSYWIN